MRSLILRHWRDAAGFCLVVLLAAAMRLGRGDIVEYFHDDAMLTTLALELAQGLRFPLTGILSSTGVPNSPVSAYFLAFPFALSSSPAFVIQFVMLWNVLGVGALWLMARRYGGSRIALIAGLLYAVNPWAALFSRKIWAQELHTPIILVALLLLLHGFCQSRADERPTRSVFLAQSLGVPLLLVGVQFHFASLPLLLLIPGMLWLGRKRIIAGALFAGALMSLLVILPYALGLAQTLGADPTRISDALARAGASGPGLSPASLIAIARLTAGNGLETWLAPEQAARLAADYPPWHVLSLALLPALLVGMLAAHRRRPAFALMLSIWAFLPGLLLIIEWTPVYIHYFIPSIPALALLIAGGADDLMRLAARWRPILGGLWLIIGVTLIGHVQVWQVALDSVETRHIAYPGFTTPLSKLEPLRDRLSGAGDVVIVAGGMAWNLHHEVARWDTLLWDRATCVRTIIPDGYAVFPNQPFAAVIAPGAPAGMATDFYRHDRPEGFPTRPGGPDYTLYQWPAAPTWTGASIRAIAPERFAKGLRLSGYGWGEDEVILEWRLPARQIGADFQFSAQLYDARGERLGQLDATFWHGRHWCAGDRLLTWGPLRKDADATTLKVALYRLGAGKEAGRVSNLEVLDGLGNPKGQSVDIALGDPGA